MDMGAISCEYRNTSTNRHTIYVFLLLLCGFPLNFDDNCRSKSPSTLGESCDTNCIGVFARETVNVDRRWWKLVQVDCT